MGSSNSKEAEAPPTPTPKAPKLKSLLQPGDIVISPNVVERFNYMRMKSLQEADNQEVAVDNDKGKIEPGPGTNSTVVNQVLEGQMAVADVKVQAMRMTSTGSQVDDKTRDLREVGSGDGVKVIVGRVVEEEKVSAGTSMKSESQKTLKDSELFTPKNEKTNPVNNDEMNKLTNFFVSDKDKPQTPGGDLEGGDDPLAAPDFDPEIQGDSYFLREPSHPLSPKYEEIDETRIGGVSLTQLFPKRSEDQMLDEEALIGTGRTPPSPRFKGVRVSRAILPIVIDSDQEGKTTVETLTAWKVKARMEKEIFKHNQHWQQELDKITTKIENETRNHAKEFETRLEQFRVKNPEEARPFQGPICKGIPTQIGKCYERNQSQVLKCSGLVREFAECTNMTGDAGGSGTR
ncbi:unnamed protein product [Orchesella dallaii]|uniref:MICOS complex subunit MIC19 n=1 Tax=Orchesella dallaii TaxID=48710 RepID=A0ABP1R0U5_9HEXA